MRIITALRQADLQMKGNQIFLNTILTPQIAWSFWVWLTQAEDDLENHPKRERKTECLGGAESMLRAIDSRNTGVLGGRVLA